MLLSPPAQCFDDDRRETRANWLALAALLALGIVSPFAEVAPADVPRAHGRPLAGTAASVTVEPSGQLERASAPARSPVRCLRPQRAASATRASASG